MKQADPSTPLRASRPSGGQAVSRRAALRSLAVIAAGVGSSSCGYALAGRGSFLPDYIKTLGIPMFGNATPYQSVEQIFTQKIRLEFQTSRRYTIVPGDEGVDGVVRGQIGSISLAPVGLNDQHLASRTRVTVVVNVKFEDIKAGKILWENPALSFSDEYELANPSSGQNVSAFV